MCVFFYFPLKVNTLHYYTMCYLFLKTFTFSHKPGNLIIYLFSYMKLSNGKKPNKVDRYGDHVSTKLLDAYFQIDLY